MKKSTFELNAFAGNAFDYSALSEMSTPLFGFGGYLNNELDMGHLVVVLSVIHILY